jgi:methionyl-tRNA formyltransferase
MVNITVLANRDLASNIALNHLLKALPNHQYQVLLSANVGKQTTRPKDLEDLAFIEQQLFNKIVFPSINKRRIEIQSELQSFEQLRTLGITIDDIQNINSEAGIASVSATQVDLIVSIRFGQILKTAVITLPTFGVLDLHSGILPDYRGVMACFWAMLNNRKEIGTTLHYIDDERIDKGTIVSIQKQPLDYKKSYLSNLLSIYAPGVESLISTINNIEAGCQISSVSQQPSAGAYYTFPTENDLQSFNEKGYRMYDYNDIIAIAQRYF